MIQTRRCWSATSTLALSFSVCWALVWLNPPGVAAAETRAPPLLADVAERQAWEFLGEPFEDGAIQATQPDGMTALHWAVVHEHAVAVQLLLDAGADVDGRTNYGVTPLSIACRRGAAQVVHILLRGGADANLATRGKETPLMTAARVGHLSIVQALIAHDADIDAVERRGQTALMWAAAEGNLAVVSALLAAGADFQRTLNSGFSALTFAAREGQIEVVEELISAGCDPRAAMKPRKTGGRHPRKGMTPLSLAVESGHFQLALRLVDLGADPNDQRSGFTPLHAISWVRKTNRGDDVSGDPPPRGSGQVSSLEFVRRLVELGADVNRPLKRGGGGVAKLTRKGATPLLLAAKTADVPLMKQLLELGADPAIHNADDCSPLLAAAGVGVVAVGEEAGAEPEVLAAVQLLLDLGVDVNHTDGNGETAMHGAAYRNFPQVVTYLARRGADPNIWNRPNRHGWTPRMIASGKRPGSFKPSPETIGALDAAAVRLPVAPGN